MDRRNFKFMAKREKKALEKKNWISNFTLIGEAKINDYTYKIDEKSNKSDWIYNSLNLGVFCGEKSGTVYAELMGGYGAERDNVVYVHGKTEDGKDDFENKFSIDWDDRDDNDILETIGDLCFMTVGLEKDKNDKVFYKRFLTPYDMIAYVKEHLEDGMVVNVKGTLKYSIYNGNTQCKKEISSIVLSKADSVDKYCAKFTQTMLLDKDCIGKADKSTGILPITAKVLDYVKEWKGKTVKCFVPYVKDFEYELDMTDPNRSKLAVDKLFKVSKGVTEITFEGELIEGGATITATMDDVPDDIKELINIGVYTEEEALAKCSVSSGREKRMIIRKPLIKMVGDDNESKKPVIQKFERKYEDEDLVLDFMFETDEEDTDSTDSIDLSDFEEIGSDDNKKNADDSMDWLNNL